jgi:hypothetical protein
MKKKRMVTEEVCDIPMNIHDSQMENMNDNSSADSDCLLLLLTEEEVLLMTGMPKQELLEVKGKAREFQFHQY